MTNDEWIAFLDRLTPDQRGSVELARTHFFDDALTSYMQAFLEMLKGYEEHLAGLRGQNAQLLGNQPLITEHLKRQDARLEGVGKSVDLLAQEFQSAGERLDEWRISVEERLATFERTRAESLQDRIRHSRLIDDLAKELRSLRTETLNFHKRSEGDRSAIHTEIAQLRTEFHDRLDDLSGRVSKLEGDGNG